ncbi:carboxypeptidase-like regulatory domain-containing protein [Paraflavitalea speifideaquila]|uniref:carboxypeptidase-like regulatory domain-containing protein n=1 Tax=Paraflavitalea speifideaquila TaxID=3076558 RepID=UPI0028E643DB|nr:carboxypeptidase-like regulatory domain-containing protein [Paraflavitalea speifideiaquila]
MTNNCCALLILLLCTQPLAAQFYTVRGKVTNNKLEPLGYASIQVKELQKGTLSQADGSYELKLEEGKYDLVISMVGFTSRIITMVVNKNTVQNFILDPSDNNGLTEVTVKAKYKDRAEEFIRQVIRHKDSILAAPGAYSCDIYIRALRKDSMAEKIKRSNPAVRCSSCCTVS